MQRRSRKAILPVPVGLYKRHFAMPRHWPTSGSSNSIGMNIDVRFKLDETLSDHLADLFLAAGHRFCRHPNISPNAHSGLIVLRPNIHPRDHILRIGTRFLNALSGANPAGRLWIVGESRIRASWRNTSAGPDFDTWGSVDQRNAVSSKPRSFLEWMRSSGASRRYSIARIPILRWLATCVL